jgi:uncharacterized protein
MEFLSLNFCDSKNLGVFPALVVTSQPLGLRSYNFYRRNFMFKEPRVDHMFDWVMLGDIELGRPNLGHQVDVAVYRLAMFTLRDVLIKNYGPENAEKIFYEAGQSAGKAFYENIIKEKTDLNKFIVNLQEELKRLKIGILRVEKADVEKMNFLLTVSEDLDCSGLPICNEEVCTYDEGFIDALLSSFTGKLFKVKEIDCWCSGDRTCRFEATLR